MQIKAAKSSLTFKSFVENMRQNANSRVQN